MRGFDVRKERELEYVPSSGIWHGDLHPFVCKSTLHIQLMGESVPFIKYIMSY